VLAFSFLEQGNKRSLRPLQANALSFDNTLGGWAITVLEADFIDRECAADSFPCDNRVKLYGQIFHGISLGFQLLKLLPPFTHGEITSCEKNKYIITKHSIIGKRIFFRFYR
jgi:hypothetical protein